jgi:hypothetical protein
MKRRGAPRDPQGRNAVARKTDNIVKSLEAPDHASLDPAAEWVPALSGYCYAG